METFDKMESYLSGQMSKIEKENFENKIMQDPDLMNDLKNYKTVKLMSDWMLERNLEDEVNKIMCDQTNTPGKIVNQPFKYILFVLFILIVLMITISIIRQDKKVENAKNIQLDTKIKDKEIHIIENIQSPEKIAAQNIRNIADEKIKEEKRNDSDRMIKKNNIENKTVQNLLKAYKDTTILIAMRGTYLFNLKDSLQLAYTQENYENVKKIWERIKTRNNNLRFLYANALIETKSYGLASYQIDTILSQGKTKYLAQSIWLKALLLIQTGENRKAIQILDEIIMDSNHPNTYDAQKLKNNMKIMYKEN